MTSTHPASFILHPSRRQWTALTEAQLLAQCEVDTYRASGPGGQKRNKTSSAVRLRHTPSGLIVIAEESRSQHRNKAKALRRLRKALFLELREPLTPLESTLEGIALHVDYANVLDAEGRLRLGEKNPRFWPVAGLILDVLCAVEARVGEAAKLLAVSTGNLIDFLETDPKVWQTANRIRQQYGRKPLRSS